MIMISKKESIKGWKYYSHAVLPDCKPYEIPDLSVLSQKGIWHRLPFKRAFFAKYTTDWDCEESTGWYWIIKDSPLNLDEMKSKHRYEIKKGLSYFEIKVIDPTQYPDELYAITVDTIGTYPKAYKSIPDKDQFVKKFHNGKLL